MSIIKHLYRYPIKGMSAEALQMTSVRTGQTIPFDRCVALAHASTNFDADNPQYLAKTNFVMLMKNAKLAKLQVYFDENYGDISIKQNGQLLIEGNLDLIEQKQALEQFFADYLGDELPDVPKLVYANDPDFSFSDVNMPVLSCINLATLRALPVEQPIDHLRFRANIYFDSEPAWIENQWLGQKFVLGTAEVEVVKLITRCAAVNVNPKTAERDLNIPNLLVQNYNHNHLGIYVAVISDGDIKINDEFKPYPNN
jgi:uncharacterized protein